VLRDTKTKWYSSGWRSRRLRKCSTPLYYSDKIGESIKTEPKQVASVGSVFTLQRNARYPMFELRLEKEPEGSPIIHCLTKLALSGDSGTEQELIDIQIIAKGQDQFFYRVAGIDRDKAETSKIVLGPFLNIM